MCPCRSKSNHASDSLLSSKVLTSGPVGVGAVRWETCPSDASDCRYAFCDAGTNANCGKGEPPTDACGALLGKEPCVEWFYCEEPGLSEYADALAAVPAGTWVSMAVVLAAIVGGWWWWRSRQNREEYTAF